MPQITLPDKSSRDFSSSLTIEELAADIGPGLAKATVAGKINGKLVDASEVITEREESVPLGLWLVIGSMVFLAGANTLRGSRWGVLP